MSVSFYCPFQKANELQDLGNGLRMNDFSQLREERQCLEEKIEGNSCLVISYVLNSEHRTFPF